MNPRVVRVATPRRGRLAWRIALALVGVAGFHLVSRWPAGSGSHFETAAYVADMPLYVYRINDCYLFARQRRSHWTTAKEERILVSFLLEEVSAGYVNRLRPGGLGMRSVDWQGGSALLVNPSRARWLFATLTLPLAVLAIWRLGSAVRHLRIDNRDAPDPPKRVLRILPDAGAVGVALLGAALFVLFSVCSLGPQNRFETVAAFRDAGLYVYRISGCYFFLPFPAAIRPYLHEDELPDPIETPSDNTRRDLEWGFENENRGPPQLSKDPRHAEIERLIWTLTKGQLERPDWHGFRLMVWGARSVPIIEPRKARWFAAIALLPLLPALVRLAHRYHRRRRGLCELCGYILMGCPSPNCPECGMPRPVSEPRIA